MEFITSNLGNRNSAYAYSKKNECKTTVQWECTQRKGVHYKSSLTTDLSMNEVRSVTEHRPEAYSFTISAMKVKAKIKSSVEANRGKTSQIVADKLAFYSKQVVVEAGTIDSLKRNVRRIIKRKTPKEPTTIKFVVSYNINIQGCFYHLTQSSWRRVQAEGLQSIYTEDEDVLNFVGVWTL